MSLVQQATVNLTAILSNSQHSNNTTGNCEFVKSGFISRLRHNDSVEFSNKFKTRFSLVGGRGSGIAAKVSKCMMLKRGNDYHASFTRTAFMNVLV